MSRRDIYYWKCDRPAAFHGTAERDARADLSEQLHAELVLRFPSEPIALTPAGGQGNHLTFRAKIGGESAFVRIEDGPEHDDYIEVESHLLSEVRALGVATPRVLAVDASRARVPFAWQALENIPHPDLNTHQKLGRLQLVEVAEKIGTAVARWQGIEPRGFGPFRTAVVHDEHALMGFHGRYDDYFMLRLDRHLAFLVDRGFIAAEEARKIESLIAEHRGLLAAEQGCLVHKDLALWNILGTETEIVAFIDWDDAISGDPMDDLSLLGCFYNGEVLARALRGYAAVRPLPEDYTRRFWLHLLRNMIVKAVIRVGAGYFERTDGFYLIGSGSSGEDLRAFTCARLAAAMHGLRTNQPIETL